MKRFLALITLALAATLPAAAANDSGGKVFAIDPQNSSGEHGTFALKPRGTKTVVEIHLLGAPTDVPQPAHIHMGTCANLNPSPKYPLTNVVNGVSETTVDVPMAQLMTSPMAVNVHKSTAEVKTYVACGNIAS